MNNSESFVVVLKWLFLGLGWKAIAFQAFFLAIASVFTTRQLIRNRIGSLDAIRIVSTPRFISCYILCLGIFLVGYQVLLHTKSPIEPKDLKWWSLKVLLSYLWFIPVLIVGAAIDGGKAIDVITSRYKPDTPREMTAFTDLTKGRGKHAQLIPRGCVRAYWILLISGWITQAIELK